MVNRTVNPVDAFLRFFQDAKPYHVKVLEVLETIRFQDDLVACLNDTANLELIYQNQDQCKITGFGIEYDENCGFDAVSCCDLFACIGDFGVIFDDSEEVANYTITSYNSDTGEMAISGDVTSDTFIQIVGFSSNGSQIILSGDQTTNLSNSSVLAISSVFTLTPVSSIANTVIINGDYRQFLVLGTQIRITKSGHYNGNYNVLGTTYDQSLNQTTIQLHTYGKNFTSNIVGSIQIRSYTKNNGYYKIDGSSYDGTNTIIDLDASTLIPFPNESRFGSVVIKTGITVDREIWIYDSVVEGYKNYKVLSVSYNILTNRTILILGARLTGIVNNVTQLSLRGYGRPSGFDSSICAGRFPNKLGALFFEELFIEIIESTCLVVSETGDEILSEDGEFIIIPESCETVDGCPVALEDGTVIVYENGTSFVQLEDCP